MTGVEISDCAMVSEKITTSKELCSEIDEAIVLEESVVLEAEWVIKLAQDDLLVLDMINMFT